MKVTKEDYQKTLERFLDDLEPIADNVVSVVLYGSMAKGTLRPGKSDVLDAMLFARGEVLEDKELFLSLLNTTTTACEHLAESGLPFKHPFHVYFTSEIQQLPEQDTAEMADDKTTKVVYGADIRGDVAASDAGRMAHRTLFYQSYRRLLPELCKLQSRESLSDDDLRILGYILKFFAKGLPQSICAAFGRIVPTMQAIDTIKQVAPQVDMEVFEIMLSDTLFDQPGAEDRVREMISSLLKLLERIHNALEK